MAYKFYKVIFLYVCYKFNHLSESIWTQCLCRHMARLEAISTQLDCFDSIGLFGVAMSPRSVSHRPRQDWRALQNVSPTQG